MTTDVASVFAGLSWPWSGRTWLVLVMSVVLAAPPLAPTVHFLASGWHRKRREIMSYFGDTKFIQAYFVQFPPGIANPSTNPEVALEQVYRSRLGLKLYIYPLILVVLIALPLGWLVSITLLLALDGEWSFDSGGEGLDPVAVAALTGAYLWLTYDLIMRDWQRALLPVDLYQVALRLVVAAPVGYAFGTLFNSSISKFVAFGVGAIPILSLVSLVRQITAKRLEQFGAKSQEEDTEDALVKLQGINHKIAGDFYAEDVYTISQLASSDPIRLAMRTNRDINFVIDSVSQALAWIYLNDKLNNIRLLGLRGAFEIRQLMLEFDYDEPTPERVQYESDQVYGEAVREHNRAVADRALAQRNLPLVAKALGLEPSQVEGTFWGIAEDPYVKLLHEVWH